MPAPPFAPIRVVLVDDHAAFRRGMRMLLERLPDVEIVGEADGAHLGVQQTVLLRPDVVLMDLTMPGMSGIDGVRQLAEVAPDVAALVVTVSAAEADVTAAMLAGAAGYVVKGASAAELGVAIRAAAAGETFLSPPVARRLLSAWRSGMEDRARGPVPAIALTTRELEVLQLIADGAENNDVAQRLHISPNTVKRHVAAILVKLGADNRTQAAVRAVRHGLI